MKEEGMKKLEEENSSLDVKKYTNDLRITIQEGLRREEKLRDINKANEANKNTNCGVNVVGVEAMDTNPIVASASSCGSDPPVVSAAVANKMTDCGVNAVGEEAMVSNPSVTSASYVVAPPVVPAAVATAAVVTPTAANAALDTTVVGSTSTQAGEASLRTALNLVPSAAPQGLRVRHLGLGVVRILATL